VKYYGSSIACSMRYFFMEYMISFDLRSIWNQTIRPEIFPTLWLFGRQ
jgi:hypothetical protein